MKKSLIALAALAAVTAASAQSTVVISGKFGSVYGKAIQGTSGLAVSDGDVRFTAVEDLGGGLKATASMELRVRGRGNVDAGASAVAAENDAAIIAQNTGVGGRNATVGLSGGFGSVTLGAIEAGNGIIGRGWGGVILTQASAYDGKLLDGASNVDWAMYETPVMNGFKLNYQRVDSVTNPGAGKGDLTGNVFGAVYDAGPISAGVDYTDFSDGDTRVRASASYDMGVAKIGFGYSDKKTQLGQYTMGLSVPIGAMTLGVVYAVNDETNAQGWAGSINYALSKRTAINASYGDISKSDTAANVGNQFRIRVMHSF